MRAWLGCGRLRGTFRGWSQVRRADNARFAVERREAQRSNRKDRARPRKARGGPDRKGLAKGRLSTTALAPPGAPFPVREGKRETGGPGA